MSLEWFEMLEKGIRVKSIRILIFLMNRYCYGHKDIPFIDFHHRFRNKPNTVDKIKDVVQLFMEKEGMSKRMAYDYANAIERIQFLTM